MSDRALDRGAQPVYLCIEFLLPVKQLPALRLLERCYEARALIALAADPAGGSLHDICGLCLSEGCHVVIVPGNGLDTKRRSPWRFAIAWPLNPVVLCFPDHSSGVSRQDQVGARKPST